MRTWKPSVFAEVVTFFNSRDHHAKAVEIGQRLQASDTVEIVHVSRELFSAGWLLFQERADKRYSLTDCISFVVMERRQIEHASARLARSSGECQSWPAHLSLNRYAPSRTSLC